MKTIRIFLMCLLCYTMGIQAVMAESLGRDLSSLPGNLYFLTESIPGNTQGQASIYEVLRGDKKMEAVFIRKEAAEAFVAALPDAAKHKRVVSTVPRSFLKDAAKMGASFILDPTTTLEGGSTIVLDVVPEKDNLELKTICDEDQADRRPAVGKEIDWVTVGPRDVKRLARVRELFRSESLSSGADYFRAALVLQHGAKPEDYLLAHDLAIVAVIKGYGTTAAWLAAASEDRFLQNIGRKQRFGTQLTNPIEVDGEVTDHLRGEMGVPPLPDGEQQAK